MRYIFLLTVLSLFTSCSEDDPKTEEIPFTTWQLFEVESWNGNIFTKEEMTIHEFIELRGDNTFIKTRVRDEEIILESSGTYEFEYADDFTYLHLDHNVDNDLIINCTAVLRESFFYAPDVITNNSSACDWPILRFEKLE